MGLYGLMGYNVERRTGEIGIRMALGARPADAARRVLGEAALLAGAGALLGVVAALGAVRVIQFYLYGVAPHDPLTLGVASVLLVLVAWLAAFLPARRAARVDPMVALRCE
jgi:ABC-type antimicrobial peptide transport system permease subunit